MATSAGALLLVLREAGFHLRQLGLTLFDGAAGGFDGGAVGVHSGVLGFGGGRHLIEFLLRNFFVLDEQRIAREIGLGFGGVGLRFGQAGGGGFAIALGNSHGGFRVGDVGFGAGDIGAVFDLRDGNIGLLRGHLAAGLRELGASLIDGDLEIARIEIHQRIARFHDLVVVDIHVGDGAVDARADGVQVSFHLGVVGGFELPRLEPKVEAHSGGNQQDQKEDDEGAATAASDGRRFRLVIQDRRWR